MIPKTDETTFRAIPTHYNGVNFRSRLEAKWAAFFDICRWPWEYEPLDLGGRIPDFVLGGSAWPRPVMVECKPCSSGDELLPYRDSLAELAHGWLREGAGALPEYQRLEHTRAAIDASDAPDLVAYDGVVARMEAITTRELVVVGTQLRVERGSCWMGHLVLVHCMGPWAAGLDPARQAAAYPHVGLTPDPSDVPGCLACGAEAFRLDHLPDSSVLGAWRDACNATQWRSVEPRGV